MFLQGTEKWEAHWPSRVTNLTGTYKFVGEGGQWRSCQVELMCCKQRLIEINRLNPRRGKLCDRQIHHTLTLTHTVVLPLSIQNQIQDELVARSKLMDACWAAQIKSWQKDQFRWSMNVISNDIYEYFIEGRECHHKFLYKEMRQEYKTNSIKHWTRPSCQKDCGQNNTRVNRGEEMNEKLGEYSRFI